MKDTGLKEKLKNKIMSNVNMAATLTDKDIGQAIDKCILEESTNTYIPLKEKVRLRVELFNSFRRLDILTELLEDDEVSEIMVNGADNIFVEKKEGLLGQTGTLKMRRSFERLYNR